MISLRRHPIGLFTLAAIAAGCSSAPTSTSGTEGPSESKGAEATSSPSAVSAPALAKSREAWRKAMARAPLPKEGCFQATHPSTTWEEVPCVTPPAVPYLPAKGGGRATHGAARRAGGETVGNGGDFSAQVSGTMSWAEGSFPSVTGVTSETDGSANNFSLQLNSNFFSGASLCNGAQTPSSCQGWQQFIYAPGATFMQYWLLDYVNACPSGWNTYGTDCFKNSSGTSVAGQPITNLGNLVLTGTAGAKDKVTMSTGTGTVYAVSQASVVNLNQGWNTAEFNIVGNAGGSEASFNDGVSIVVQTLTDSLTPTTAAPSCESEGFTGETNNLNLVSNSCCAIGGVSPGIQFTESNASGATAQACPPSPVSITEWSGATFSGEENPYSTELADVNGDGSADAVAFSGSSTWVMLSNGTSFGAPTEWSNQNFFGVAPSQIANGDQLGDVNGDGKADAVAFSVSSTWVMLSNGSSFGAPTEWSSSTFSGEENAFSTALADVNGDGKADAVAFSGSSTWVMLSNGSSFGAPTEWSNQNFVGVASTSLIANPTQLADVNGDGKADAVAFSISSTWVMLSNGSGFGAPTEWSGSTFSGEQNAFSTELADVNGDGKADAVAFSGGTTWVMLSNGSSFDAPFEWANVAFYSEASASQIANGTQLADVNGDGRADGVAFDLNSTWVMTTN